MIVARITTGMDTNSRRPMYAITAHVSSKGSRGFWVYRPEVWTSYEEGGGGDARRGDACASGRVGPVFDVPGEAVLRRVVAHAADRRLIPELRRLLEQRNHRDLAGRELLVDLVVERRPGDRVRSRVRLRQQLVDRRVLDLGVVR